FIKTTAPITKRDCLLVDILLYIHLSYEYNIHAKALPFYHEYKFTYEGISRACPFMRGRD
ncbi:unnamed protein product, partial [Dovyalis caffra]